MKIILITTSLSALLFVGTITGNKDLPLTKAAKHHNTSTSVAAALPKVIEYDFAKQVIRKTYYPNLDRLAEAAIKDNYLISLGGHADSIGAYKANWVLSDKRAGQVKEYLVKKGVKDDRIVTTPYGSTVPIASNKTAEGRQKNRRVEISMKDASK
jgi:outer membrane protein OmpA-like peptidoglycan-associated protein